MFLRPFYAVAHIPYLCCSVPCLFTSLSRRPVDGWLTECIDKSYSVRGSEKTWVRRSQRFGYVSKEVDPAAGRLGVIGRVLDL